MFEPDEMEEFDKAFGEGSAGWVEEVNDYYKIFTDGEELYYSIFGPAKIMQLRDVIKMRGFNWSPNIVAYALFCSRIMMGLFQNDVEVEMLLRQDTGGVTH